MTAFALAALISSYRFPYSSEAELQERIAELLTDNGLPFRREVQLTPSDRPDFMVCSVAVEVKIDGPRAAVIRQLHRYAQHEEVASIVLVTSKANHRMPPALNGKRVVVASLLGGAF